MNKSSFLKFLLIFTTLFTLSAYASEDKLLFVQIAKSGSIQSLNQPNLFKLTLNQIEPYTSYFTDRPNRRTGLIPTAGFVNQWHHLKDVEQTPPNVALETSTIKDGTRINYIFELSNPVYNAHAKQLSYTAKLLNNQPTAELDQGVVKIGYTALFIDDFVWKGNKFGH